MVGVGGSSPLGRTIRKQFININKILRLHILAQREHSFWTNVNTDSGST